MQSQFGKEPEPLEKTKDPEVLSPPYITQAAEKISAPPAPPPQKLMNAENESRWNKWMHNNPDLEKFIGENLVNKIGIAVLVLGIAFFVKYAIDKEWINETGRVCIGIACGIIMIGIAHRLVSSYRSFSSVLAGGGIAVFYFTIAFAFHEYNLFTQTTAFIIMVVITAFAVALALLYDKIELAVIAVIGGFLVPFLVSNGSNNYVALFTYLLILDTGILIMAYFKKWPLLHVLSFFFTFIIYTGWLLQEFLMRAAVLLPYKNALFFAAAFYLIFITTVLIHNLRMKKPFKATDFSLLLIITASFYAEGMLVLNTWQHGAYQGIFNVVLAMINLALAWFLYKKQKGDNNLLYLLIGLTITFISLAAPVQLHGHSITMFWSAEAVLLYWLHQRSRINTFKYFSLLVLVCMFFSLMMDWLLAHQRNKDGLIVIFNNWQGITTNLVAVISLGCYAALLRKEANEIYLAGLKNKAIAISTLCVSILILYLTFIFGINLFFINETTYDIPNAYHQLITYIFIAVITVLFQKLKVLVNSVNVVVLILSGFLFYVLSAWRSGNLITGIIKHDYAGIHSAAHWVAAVCMLYLLYQLVMIIRKDFTGAGNKYAWLTSMLLLVFFSIEFNLVYISLFAGPASLEVFTSQYMKAGLTIVWASFSFALMWLGMKYKYKVLRIISLSIFCAALVKLFLFDIRNISDGGKIAAFIMLGILLLVISFMYQRLKKIIIDDENKRV